MLRLFSHHMGILGRPFAQACEGVWDATTPTSTPATVTVTPTAVLVLLGSYFCTIVSLHF